jgi:hypothetical protein
VKFCYEHPLLIEEVVAVEEKFGPPAVYESIEAERGRENVYVAKQYSSFTIAIRQAYGKC